MPAPMKFDTSLAAMPKARPPTLVRVTRAVGATPTIRGASAQRGPHDPDDSVLAGVLAVLPPGTVAVVAEVLEAVPLPLQRRMAALGGRIIHRRPRRGIADDLAPDLATRDFDATLTKIAVLEDRLAGTTGTTKALLAARLAQLRAELRAPATPMTAAGRSGTKGRTLKDRAAPPRAPACRQAQDGASPQANA